MAAAHVALVLAFIGLLVWGDLDPGPAEAARGAACITIDDGNHRLLDLARRRPEEAALAQLERWDMCDTTLRGQAEDAVRRDWALVAIIAAGLALGLVRGLRTRRWRTAAGFSAVLAATYVVADLLENRWLLQLLGEGDPSVWLPWATALKGGAFLGAVPIFFISLAGSFGEMFATTSADEADVAADPAKRGVRVDRPQMATAKPARRAVGDFRVRWLDRMIGERTEATTPVVPETPPDVGLGVACSGGGIRSAAFNLGALQALESPADQLKEVKVISAVSGGSYMAAAWVTARRTTSSASAWSRLSPEETHLRRNSSYMAPGFGGKLWAVARYGFGFVVNIGLIVLFLGVLFVPAGRLVSEYSEPQPTGAGGRIDLPDGGCIQLPDTTVRTVVAGEHLRLATSGPARLAPGGPVQAAPPTGAAASTSTVCPAARTASAVGDDLQAAAPGRRLEKAARVLLALDRPIPVTGTTVASCQAGRPCAAQDAAVVPVPAGSRLLGAPRATLTLPADAIVEGEGTLVSACGSSACRRYVAPSGAKVFLGVLLALAGLAGIGLVVARSNPATAKRTEWFAKRFSLAALLVGLTAFGFPLLVVWAENGRWLLHDAELEAGGGGAVAVLLALAAQVRPFLGGVGSRAGKSGLAKGVRSLASRLRPLLIRLAGAVVGPLVVIAIAIAFASYAAQQSGGQNQPGQVRLWLALVGPLVVLLLGADLNEWSLHPYYRDRLRSAFAVDPVADPPEDPREDPLGSMPAGQPTLIICASANLADTRATAPGRPVISWTFCGSQMGSPALGKLRQGPDVGGATGFIESQDLPAHLRHLAWAWTAVSVSGAAFSPAMGKMSRPERALLVLGNLRLGVWYPNPRWFAADREWYTNRSPRPWYLAKEALGIHRVHDRWLYLTDGGHYENLGLVELIRAGCRQIYCFDAAGDAPETFGTLAEAMRLARQELGVEIMFDPEAMIPDADGMSVVGVGAGTLRWSDESEPSGWIVVAKLSVPKTAPFDIVDLARTLPSFPTHPTADQLYTDQKFEAYRALGHHLGCQAASLGATIMGLQTAGGLSPEDAVNTANAWLLPADGPDAEPDE